MKKLVVRYVTWLHMYEYVRDSFKLVPAYSYESCRKIHVTHMKICVTCATRLLRHGDSYMWHDSFICGTWLWLWSHQYECAWHHSCDTTPSHWWLLYVTWLHTYVAHIFIGVTWLIYSYMSHIYSYVWHDSYIQMGGVLSHIGVTNMKESCRKSHVTHMNICVTCDVTPHIWIYIWLLHIGGSIIICVTWFLRQDSFPFVTPTCDKAPYMWIYAWLQHNGDSYMWHDSFICGTWFWL